MFLSHNVPDPFSHSYKTCNITVLYMIHTKICNEKKLQVLRLMKKWRVRIYSFFTLIKTCQNFNYLQKLVQKSAWIELGQYKKSSTNPYTELWHLHMEHLIAGRWCHLCPEAPLSLHSWFQISVQWHYLITHGIISAEVLFPATSYFLPNSPAGSKMIQRCKCFLWIFQTFIHKQKCAETIQFCRYLKIKNRQKNLLLLHLRM